MACSIPDLPWILQRSLLSLEFLDPLDLRLYTTVQASLVFCLIFSAALAQLSRNPGRAFALLGFNCLLHLLLDATQIKWANGVHFFLPISWSAVQWHIFWPEHPLGPIITAGGFFYYLRIWPRLLAEKPQWPRFGANRGLILVCCLLFYLTGPFLFSQKLEKTGFYSINTLRDRAARPGKLVEFDRVPYSASEKTITILTGERIRLSGEVPKKSGLISLQGQFLSPATVQTGRYHQHSKMRDWASLLGLFMTCTLLVQTLILSRFPFHQPLKGQQV